MHFTYEAYKNLLSDLKAHGYETASYENWQEKGRCVILRHDIDNDISKALQLAKLEWNVGVKSAYFVLVTSDFYNVFSARSGALLQEIAACGHESGLPDTGGCAGIDTERGGAAGAGCRCAGKNSVHASSQ